ncbi:MAG: hypothetical protein JNJ59_13055 [Deltaproteobacteria bacterium]|nr:hypothetical protein [Deltaproteobacteria bacterium]
MNRYLSSSSAVLAAAFSFGLAACDSDDPATDTTDTVTDTNTNPDTTDTNTNPDTDATTTPDTDTAGDTTVTDPCDPNPCTTAPAATCDGTTKKVTYAATGTCTANGTAASCAYAPTTTNCGNGEVCAAGACVAAGDVCDYVFVDRVSYVTHIAVGNQAAATGGVTPDACCFDFTGDDKVDNKLGSVLKAASGLLNLDINATIAEQITSGSLTLLLETKGVDDAANDSSVAIAGFYGASVDANAAAGTGHFTANPSSFQTGTNVPLISFPTAKIVSSVLTAGPNLFQLSLPIVGAQLDIAVTNTQLEGTVAVGPNGKGLTMDGNGGLGAKLGGVVKKKDLYDALNGYLSTCTCVTGGALISEAGTCNTLNTSACDNATDGQACTALPQYCSALIGLLSADVDLNEDGDTKDIDDGISIGVWVKATSGTVDGVDQCEAK